jgi:hypothetical protein
MPVIDPNIQQALRERFKERMRDQVTIRLFTQSAASSLLTVPGRPECQFCAETEELTKELVELSPLLKLEVHDFHGAGAELARELGVERIPALVLGDDHEGRVKLYGLPMGYEFAILIEGIEALSQAAPPLSERVAIAAQKSIRDPVHLQVFVTPT